MAFTIREATEAWATDIWKMAEDFANNMKSEVKPFYIVYAAKQDKHQERVFRQTIKAYFHRPQPMLGILVWYVDNQSGIFQFVPELSAPPDVPVDPSLLSQNPEDSSQRVAALGEKMKVILS